MHDSTKIPGLRQRPTRFWAALLAMVAVGRTEKDSRVEVQD